MTPERFRQVRDLFEAALERDSEGRTAWLEQACEGDLDLCGEVQRLLIADALNSNAPDRPALDDDKSLPRLEGRRIGAYQIRHEIGRGGMGVVYSATRADDAFRRNVAFKIVRSDCGSAEVIHRFRQERNILAGLDHPHVARLLDGGTTEEGLPYFVMEYVEGEPIDKYCDQHRLNITERLNLFRSVCSAVQYAHDKLVVHRDLKPSNILVKADGTVKLLDFGIANLLGTEAYDTTVYLTQPGLHLMTPEYASPEQVKYEPITTATDVYSLGVVLYELVTGHRPYRIKGRLLNEVIRVICEVEPTRPSTVISRVEQALADGQEVRTITPEAVSEPREGTPAKLAKRLTGDLDAILLMALRKDPRCRYASVRQFEADLQRHLDQAPVFANKRDIRYAFQHLLRRRSKQLRFAGAVFACVLITAEGVLWLTSRTFNRHNAPVLVKQIIPAGDMLYPTLSPNGNAIAYLWKAQQDKRFSIYVTYLDGLRPTEVISGLGVNAFPTWSPDGRYIAFVRPSGATTSAFVVPTRGGSEHDLANLHSYGIVDPVGMDWSPDGQTLAIAHSSAAGSRVHHTRIALISLRSGLGLRMDYPPPGSYDDVNPIFSPDSKTLAFIRWSATGVSDLYYLPQGDTTPRRLTRDNRRIRSATWTCDGREIIFSSDRAGPSTLWRVAIAGGRPPKQLVEVGAGVDWVACSRSGDHLAYVESVRRSTIWQLELSGNNSSPGAILSNNQIIDSGVSYSSSPQFSPDGSRIAFGSDRSGNDEIWVSNSDGSNPVQITSLLGPHTGTPRWSPDGSQLVFDSRVFGNSDIFVVNAKGGAMRQLTTETSEEQVPTWSRDGKWIYFTSNRSGENQVWKSPVEGGRAVQVTKQGGSNAAEATDGHSIYYTRQIGDTDRLCRMDTRTGQEELINEVANVTGWGHWTVGRSGLYYITYLKRHDKNVMAIEYLDCVSRKTTELYVLNSYPGPHPALSISPDGRRLLYTKWEPKTARLMLIKEFR